MFAIHPCQQHQTYKKNTSTLSLLLAAPYPNSLLLSPYTAKSNMHTHGTGAGMCLGSWAGAQAAAPATRSHGMAGRKVWGVFWSTLVRGSWPPAKPTVLFVCIQLEKVY